MEYQTAKVENGRVVITSSKQIEPKRCPHFIMVGQHYREDGSCKCDDPNETIMAEWGYTWNGTGWIA